MADQTALPDAKLPSNVALMLHNELDVHASGDTDVRSDGTSFKVVAWIDSENASPEEALRARERIEEAGYDVERSLVEHDHTPDSIKLKGRASAE